MLRVSIVLSYLLTGACSELGEFATDGETVYRGRVVGTDSPECDPGTSCSFIRRGFAVDTQIELELDPEVTNSGRITTTGEPCGPTLEGAVLQSIPALDHDQLGELDFPGEARLRNYMFVVRPTTGPLAGRDAMAVVSLIRGGGIEVRFIAGSSQNDCDPNDCAALASGMCDFFGVFRTRRERR